MNPFILYLSIVFRVLRSLGHVINNFTLLATIPSKHFKVGRKKSKSEEMKDKDKRGIKRFPFHMPKSDPTSPAGTTKMEQSSLPPLDFHKHLSGR